MFSFTWNDIPHTSIQASVSLLPDDAPEGGQHVLPGSIPARNVHPALDSNVRVGDAGSQQLAQRTKVERILGCDPPPLLQHLLQLLEDGVLQDRVDDQDQRRHDASEQARGALIADEGEERAKRRWRLLRGCRCARERLVGGFGFARRHARVDDPDGVGHEDGCAAGEGACHHGLDRGELGGGATGFERSLLEEGAGPFVP